MNSMFSCFDAFCIEVLFGKTPTSTPRVSVSSSGDAKASQRNDRATAEKTIGKKLDGNGEFAEKAETKKPQKIRSVPEFDGLNCFETLVPY
ncbi:hypothetical protein TIFTF001_003170 [Ficus carica]|uniref:Uncharacterized protein n=1 Tax=Ficus carica TaxID=3494 RepID=A0AA87ZEN6_FICCA|nr:hypothetical protein TIFTF001_003170 [Ficus carica]